MYVKKNNELIKTKQSLENTRKNIELMAKGDFSNALYMLELSRKAPDLFENAEIEEKCLLINTVLSNLEMEDKLLRRKIKEPYNTMALCSKTQNWLGVW